MSEALLEKVREDFIVTWDRFADGYDQLAGLTDADRKLVKATAEIFYAFGRSDSLTVAAAQLMQMDGPPPTDLETEAFADLSAAFLFMNRWSAGETANYYGREMDAHEAISNVYMLLASITTKLKTHIEGEAA